MRIRNSVGRRGLRLCDPVTRLFVCEGLDCIHIG
jgi:hypothetical protein